jgi:hypothetical protein
MLMQFCFGEGIVKMKAFNKTDWNNVIYKKDYPAYYILTKTLENHDVKDASGNIFIVEPFTINLRLDSVKTYIDKDEYPNNAIIAFFYEWLYNSSFILDMCYIFENEIHIEKTAKELNIL